MSGKVRRKRISEQLVD